jgi:methionine-rich copper-binding protein CopC
MNHTMSFALLLALMLPVAASAHAMLQRATPSADAIVHGSPALVNLEFSDQLEPSFSSLTVTDDSGHAVTNGDASISGTMMTAKLNRLHPGRYHVQWHAVSIDTHRTEGAYSFTVAP